MRSKRFDVVSTPKDREFVARITSDVSDRDGEVLLPGGMDSADFEKNPVVFMAHDYQRLPVGVVTALSRDSEGWLAAVRLAERPANHPGEWLPDAVLSLIQQRVIRGVSVGFEVVEAGRPTPAERERYGHEVHTVYRRWKLLELSVAPLPANQDALILAVAKSVKRRKRYTLYVPDLSRPVDIWKGYYFP